MGNGSDRQKKLDKVLRDHRKKLEKTASAKKQKQVAKPKTNEAALYPTKRGELPDRFVMDVIADSLHEEVTGVFNEIDKAGADTSTATPNANVKGRCLYYAGAGQYLAERILGREYFVQVGSLGVNIDSEMMFKIDAEKGGVAARSFHMWLGSDDGGIVEFVDFTSRFFKDWAIDAGMRWEREDVPPYLWGIQADFKEKHGVYHQTVIKEEPEASKMIAANQKLLDVIEEQAVAIARKRLNL